MKGRWISGTMHGYVTCCSTDSTRECAHVGCRSVEHCGVRRAGEGDIMSDTTVPTVSSGPSGRSLPDDWDFEAEVATLQHDRRAWQRARGPAAGGRPAAAVAAAAVVSAQAAGSPAESSKAASASLVAPSGSPSPTGSRPWPSEPPALPIPLRRRRRDDAAWFAALPEATRAVLEGARARPLPWPRGPRVPGAVAQPLQKIPSLVCRSARPS
jgi:hypothetical protein